ncbi:hypothetical protein ONZ45_g18988 [Pleurotus djamor]|nr:hypothetical protein ONZ45_g18988 [Pleurotus djamor]
MVSSIFKHPISHLPRVSRVIHRRLQTLKRLERDSIDLASHSVDKISVNLEDDALRGKHWTELDGVKYSISTNERRDNTLTLSTKKIQKTGSQAVLEALLRRGVDIVFGYPGGAIADIQNVVYGDPRISPVMPRHEQGAGHMAEGYARITGKPGVIFVTSGPGATNLLTPIQDAFSDGIPMVVFAGQVPLRAMGTEAFQSVDVVRIMESCTKWAVTVKDAASLGPVVDEAFQIATSGRPGPVILDIPSCVAASTYVEEDTAPSLPDAQLCPTQLDVGANLEKVASMINNAEMPLIIAGAG